MSAICSTPECGRTRYTLDLCKTCYGRQWRSKQPGATIRSPNDRRLVERKFDTDSEAAKCVSLETELSRVKKIYDVAVGLECRLKWRREINRLEEELREVRHERSAV